MAPRSFAPVVLALLALAACGSPTAPRMLPTSIVTSQGPGPLPALGATVAGDTVVVTGSIGLGVPCYEFSATTTSRQDSLIVTLTASPVGVVCTQNAVVFGYAITVRDVPPGTWKLHLLYDRRGSVAL